jgi:hypothetical protein
VRTRDILEKERWEVRGVWAASVRARGVVKGMKGGILSCVCDTARGGVEIGCVE